MSFVFDLCPATLIVAIISIIALMLFWYSEDRKLWFHLFIKQILEDKNLLALFFICIVVMLVCGTYRLDISIKLTNGYTCSTRNVLLTLAGGYMSGYLVYLLTNEMPKAKKKKSILSIFKNRLYYLKCEIEEQLCGKDTNNIEIIQCDIKKYAKWNKEMGAYAIETTNVKYYLCFMDSILDTLNSIMPYASYLDMNNLELIERTMHYATWYSKRLRDYQSNSAYPEDSDIKKLAEKITIIYNNITEFHSNLEKIV